MTVLGKRPYQPQPTTKGRISVHPEGDHIIDQHGRLFDYVRIAVNERCNLRCIYCLPEEGIDFLPSEQLLTSQEIIRIVHILAQLQVTKVRFTGGEPLLRKDMAHLVSQASITPGIESVHITTNGLLLSEYANDLYKAGLHGINISLDTMDRQKFLKITRSDCLDKVLEGLNLALSLPFPSVKVNVVVMRDFNHEEIGDFVELTRDNRLTVRFIELMPFDAHQIWKTGKFFGAEKILEYLSGLYPHMDEEEGSVTEEHVYRIPGHEGKFAVIPSFTRSLCEGCNRIRLTADGKIRNCLYSDNEFDVKKLARQGDSHEKIADLFKRAMWTKLKDGWEAQHRGNHLRESMTQIGG
ncbi:MAG: GTP 3',8-cyclase MoaA [Candidatus Neomarinimicrobiota bacterium]